MIKIEECYPFNLFSLPIVKGGLDTDVMDLNIRKVLDAISILPDREQKVLELRFDEHKTLDEVGTVIGVTRERVRQIEVKAFRKLRVFLRDGYCEMAPKRDLILANRKIAALERQIELLSANINLPLAEERETTFSLDYMDLSVRTYNCLRRAGLATLDDIIQFDKAQRTRTPIEMEETDYKYSSWSHIRNFGRRSYDELKKKVYELSDYTISDIQFDKPTE